MKKLTIVAIFTMAGSLFVFQGRAQNIFPSSGNAGIGTTSPASPLDIRVGGITPFGTASGLSTGVTSSFGLVWSNFNATTIQTSGNTQGVNGVGATLMTSDSAGKTISLASAGAFQIQLTGPGAVTNAVGLGSSLQMPNTSTQAVTNGFFFKASPIIINGSSSSGSITNGYGYFMAPFTSNFVNKYGVYINDSSATNYFGGTMTIGTRTVPPGYTLAVNGSAIFTKAVVQTFSTWPDYIFGEGYRLQPLDSLAAFIRTNSHLPEMPSAGEVREKGLDVGSNEAALLKKVEELTLYLIRQNDSLKAQQQEIEELKKKIGELSAGR